MRRSEITALGDLAGEALSAGSGFIGEMHHGIASRPFGILGPAAAPVRWIHNGVTGRVYAGLRGASRSAARSAAALVAQNGSDGGPELAATPIGAIGMAALNGLYGNHMREQGSPLALEIEIRRQGRPVPVTAEGLAHAFPDATSRVAVFLHGLFETDESWGHFPLGGDSARRRTYGERLQGELGYTPIQVRYNTGLHVSENGHALARLLEELVAAWPTEVAEITLVGHSMGGLVARSACHYGRQDAHGWTHSVRHVFCLGAPHLGADVEKGLHLLAWACGRLPETRALGSLVNARSVGIKDLRFGSCLHEDWSDCDPDEFLQDRCQEFPFLPDASYYFVAAYITESPLGSWLGDLLVRTPSASGRGSGRGRRIEFEVENGLELGGLTHFDLLNHPAVYRQIHDWLTRAPRQLQASSV